MLTLSKNIEEYSLDFIELIKMFDNNENFEIDIKATNENKCIVQIKINNKIFNYERDAIENSNLTIYNRNFKRFIKLNLYKALCKFCHKKLIWGALTGIRPAKLVYDEILEGKTLEQSLNQVKKEFMISSQKMELLTKVMDSQKKVITKEKSCCLYIHIPVCPTRCTYCSFVATDFKNAYKYLDDYVKYLKQEIEFCIENIKEKNIKINSIYIGGGTPTTLTAHQLEELLKPLQQFKGIEFTVECGRADTITKEKLDVLKSNNVTRISINPQTFNNIVLETIGRKHTAKNVFEAYELAKNYGFNINMDFIAGLPNDNFKSFKNSINLALKLNPQNLTVHTLSIKNAGLLKYMNNANIPSNKEVNKMLNFSYKMLNKNKYMPYYLYRQKNMIGFLENVGFCKYGTECLFNIYSMEELKPVIACGAGAISKYIDYKSNKIERIANVKQLSDYIVRFNEMLERKKELFQNI